MNFTPFLFLKNDKGGKKSKIRIVLWVFLVSILLINQMEISGFKLNGPKFVCDMTTIDGNVKSGPLTTTKHFSNALNHFKRGDRRNQFFTKSKVIHPKHYKLLKKGAHQSRLGRQKMGWFLAD